MNEDIIRLRLYVSGKAPNSLLALQNLEKTCERYLPGRFHIEVIDLFKEPERALSDKVLLTPLLRILNHSSPRSIIGNLSNRETLLGALEIRANDSPD